ncbi:unnamed protein product [Phytomonas sp. Hart1]|nr:unnamed protein product [Phytomonas sp. Hart1]|eukprot:CCW68793.1 unnamed protein product [Phytomonas sp. isolate Hart1]
MKEKAAVDAREKQRLEQEDRCRLQEHVRSFRNQLALSKNEALARCNSEKRRLNIEIKKETNQIQEDAQEAEEQRRLAQSQMIQDIRLLRVRIKERKKELARHKCAAWVGGEGEPTGYEDSGNEKSRMNVQESLAESRARGRELEEVNRQKIAAAHERMREEIQNMERIIEAQRQRSSKERELLCELKECKEEAARSVKEAFHATRVLEMYDKLHSKRLKHLQSSREIREEDRKCRNDKILRNASSGAVESERWRQLEQGLHNHILSTQALQKSCAASL